MTAEYTCDARYKSPYNGDIARCELEGSHYLVHRGEGYVWKFEDSIKEEPVRPNVTPQGPDVAVPAKNKQVGGDHYQMSIQPFDVIDAWGLDFYEGSALKYLARHKKKNGREDLEKAIHYIELTIERQYSDD